MELINATLVVQCGNFFIAYLILRRLVFAPAVAVLEQKQAVEIAEQQNIEKAYAKIKQQEQEKNKTWQQCRKNLAEQVPSLQTMRSYGIRQQRRTIVQPRVDEHSLSQIQKELSEHIATLVDRVYE